MARKVVAPSQETETYDYPVNTKKSFREIAEEVHTPELEPETPKAPEKPEDKEIKEPKEDKKEVKSPLDEAREFVEKQKSEIAENAKKEAEQAAKQTLKEELDKIKESDLSKKEKEEAAEKARARWTGIDKETGNIVPKNYDEIVEETLRLADERFEKLYEERRAREAEQARAEQEKVKQGEQAAQQQFEEVKKTINNKIESELEELYDQGHLTRPKSQDDTDPDEKARRELFKEAFEFNQKRIAEGKPPVDSIAKFYFMYHKKSDGQPAGADAPIGGAKNTPNTPSEPKISYAELHTSSFRQLRNKLFGK